MIQQYMLPNITNIQLVNVVQRNQSKMTCEYAKQSILLDHTKNVSESHIPPIRSQTMILHFVYNATFFVPILFTICRYSKKTTQRNFKI
jgi:hypothetical protein